MAALLNQRDFLIKAQSFAGHWSLSICIKMDMSDLGFCYALFYSVMVGRTRCFTYHFHSPLNELCVIIVASTKKMSEPLPD